MKQNFLFDLEKLIECWVSAVNIVSSNLFVGPSPRMKIFVPLLLVCTDEPISAPKNNFSYASICK